MLKKAVLALTFIIFILELTACKTTSQKLPKLDPKNPVTISIWNYYSGAQKEAFDKEVTEFNDTVGRDKGIIVEALSEGSVTDLANKTLASARGELGSEALPDVFAGYSDTLYELDSLGIIAPLDKYMSSKNINEYVQGFVDEARSLSGGNFKIFPIAKATELLYVNKTDWDKFVKAVTVDDISNKYDDVSDKDLLTWEGIYKVAEVYNKWTDDQTPNISGDGKMLMGFDSVANFQIIANKQLGVDIVKSENGKGYINIDETAQKKIWDFYYKGIVKGYIGAVGRFRSDDVKTGKMLMYIGSSSGAAYMPTQVTLENGSTYDIKTSMLQLPTFTGGKKIAIQQGAGMAVKKSNPQKEYAAVVFLRYITDINKNIEFSIASNYLPVKKEAIASKVMSGNIENLKKDNNIQHENMAMGLEISLQQMKNYDLYSAPPFKGSNEVRTELENTTISTSEEARNTVLKQKNKLEDSISEVTDENYFKQYIQKLKDNVQKQIK